MKLKFNIDKPKHGWLPCEISYGDFSLQFMASDIPNNPIEELQDCLLNNVSGYSSQVWWHLEPAGYFFEFHVIDDLVDFRIYFYEDSSKQSKNKIFAIKLNIISLYLIFYRAICKFKSFDFKEGDWTTNVNFEKLNKIKKRLKIKP